MVRKNWSAEDDAAFLQMAQDGVAVTEMATRLGRTVPAIHGRARTHNVDLLGSPKKPHWATEEIEVLKANYATATREQLSQLFPNRDWQAITHKALRVRQRRDALAHRLTPSTVNRLDTPTAAYIAGFLDGEGTISVGIQAGRGQTRPATPNLAPFVGLTNTHRGVIDWLITTIGAGCVLGSPVYRPKTDKPVFHVRLNRINDIQDFLGQVRPFLRVKHAQADLLMEFCVLRAKGNKSHYHPRLFDITIAVRKLNERGPPDATPDMEPTGTPTLLATNTPSP